MWRSSGKLARDRPGQGLDVVLRLDVAQAVAEVPEQGQGTQWILDGRALRDPGRPFPTPPLLRRRGGERAEAEEMWRTGREGRGAVARRRQGTATDGAVAPARPCHSGGRQALDGWTRRGTRGRLPPQPFLLVKHAQAQQLARHGVQGARAARARAALWVPAARRRRRQTRAPAGAALEARRREPPARRRRRAAPGRRGTVGGRASRRDLAGIRLSPDVEHPRVVVRGGGGRALERPDGLRAGGLRPPALGTPRP